MTDAFQRLRDAIATGDVDALTPEEFAEPVHRRLVNALRGRTRGACGPADLAGLVAHVLLRESAQLGGARQSLSVPIDAEWPARAIWERAGLRVSDSGQLRLLRCDPWRPDWLDSQGQISPGQAAFGEVERRNYVEVPADPFLLATGLSNYRCVGQREAVRSVMSMPNGTTLVVTLPTGAGKSLCSHLPALISSEPATGLTIVVVPTTALAIDQERGLTTSFGHHTAFYDSGDAGDDRRTGIVQRILAGNQRIVFTSPESLQTGLKHALYEAARRGWIRYLVVDEAHMVEQWGDEFRSSFQELAGLRHDLTRQCPSRETFRTVLLTATLTPECLSTLRALFAPANHPEGGRTFGVVASVQLRPEPEFWIRKASVVDREQFVLEAVHRLPRSIILYVTRPSHAESWKHRLRSLGYTRCESVTGKTPPNERERVIRQWRDHQTDIVVATSAFGLGMDQSDVRTVIHACVPESIDRFYQEVGRGGRDGRASVSLTVYTADDLAAARRLNRSTIIGIGRGRQRWLRMFGDARATALGDERIRVPVNVVPTLRSVDIDMTNDYNVAWNVRTLTLMNRAGLIALDAEAPQHRDMQAITPGGLRSSHTEAPTRVIRVLDVGHREETVWKARVDPIRRRASARDAKAYELMRSVLDGRQACIADQFAAAYEILDGLANESNGYRVRVSRSCGGCPWCRARRRAPYAGAMPVPGPVWPAEVNLRSALDRVMRGSSIAVFCPPSSKRTIDRLVGWLISQGCRTVVSPDLEARQWAERMSTKITTAATFVIPLSEYSVTAAPRLPAVFVLNEQRDMPDDLISARQEHNGRPAHMSVPHVYLLHADARSSSRPDRRLRDSVRLPRFTLEELESLAGL